MSVETLMTVLEKEQNRMDVDQRGAVCTETDDLDAISSSSHTAATQGSVAA